MAFEVELKARIEEAFLLLARLRSSPYAATETVVDRSDTYLYNEEADHTIRLRKETGALLITAKERRVEEGIEINAEHEFSINVDEKAAALTFFAALGYHRSAVKRKAGFSYTMTSTGGLPPLTIELCEVIPLGWFVELEYLVEDKKQIEDAKRGLLEALETLDIATSQIEKKPYLLLLNQLGREEHPPHRGSEP